MGLRRSARRRPIASVRENADSTRGVASQPALPTARSPASASVWGIAGSTRGAASRPALLTANNRTSARGVDNAAWSMAAACPRALPTASSRAFASRKVSAISTTIHARGRSTAECMRASQTMGSRVSSRSPTSSTSYAPPSARSWTLDEASRESLRNCLESQRAKWAGIGLTLADLLGENSRIGRRQLASPAAAYVGGGLALFGGLSDCPRR